MNERPTPGINKSTRSRRPAHPAARQPHSDGSLGPDPSVAHTVEAVSMVIGARDARLLVEYRIQQIAGNATPAATVAGMFGMRTADVNHIMRRSRVALARAANRGNRSFARLAWAAA